MQDLSIFNEAELSELTKEEKTILAIMSPIRIKATEVMSKNDYERIQRRIDNLSGTITAVKLSGYYQNILNIENPSIRLKEGVIDLDRKHLHDSLEAIAKLRKPFSVGECDLEETDTSSVMSDAT